MGEPAAARNQRMISIADHLWDSFANMSQDMGVERDGLINQALFAFARQHGYLSATNVANRAVSLDADGAPAAEDVPVEPAQQQTAPPPPSTRLTASASVVAQRSAAPPPAQSTGFTGMSMPVLDLPVPEPEPAYAPPEADLGLEMAVSEAPSAGGAAVGDGVLVLFAEGREVDRVVNPRFLIGRGKHCDLIINSGKVSREHAAIIREGEAYFIEDLGSSNGTWFDKKRITRRKIEEGDEYFVCSEKITCRFM